MGFGSSTLQWEELLDVVKRMAAHVQPINILALGSRDMFDANNKAVDYSLGL
jgi:hypothetical protein